MSKNFEVLQRLEQHRTGVLPQAAAPAPAFSSPAAATAVAAPELVTVDRENNRELVGLTRTLFIAPGVKAPHVVGFFGVEADGEASRVCAKTAEVLAATVSSKVCLVDANSSGALHEYFDVDRRPGFLEALGGTEGAVRQVRNRLWFMPSGTGVPHSGFERLPDVIRALRREFDFVLLAMPTNSVATTPTQYQGIDGAVLVVEANKTRRGVASAMKQQLELSGVSLLGTVLNNRRYPVPQRLYRYL